MVRATETARPRDLREFEDELRATLAARREIAPDPDMDDALAANFLKRIESAIDARMDARMAEYGRGRGVRQRNASGPLGTTLGIAIPLVVLAGIFGGADAIVAVCAMVLILSLAALFKS